MRFRVEFDTNMDFNGQHKNKHPEQGWKGGQAAHDVRDQQMQGVTVTNDTSSPCEQRAVRGGFFGCMALGSRFEGKLSFGLLGLFGLGLPLLGEPRKRIPGTVQSDACGK